MISYKNKIFTGFAFLSFATLNAQTAPKYNVIFILADDLGARDLGCYGSTFYETPNIDALARDGVLFSNAYAACSVSSPTRASILTGKYPTRVDITDWIPGRQANDSDSEPFKMMPPEFTLNLNKNEFTIANAVKTAGYKTFFIGKWHLGENESLDPTKFGFDINIGGGKFGHPPKGYFPPYGLPNLTDGKQGEYLTDRLSDEAVKLIDNLKKDEKFLLYYADYNVHTPLQAKPDKVQYFEEKAKHLGLTDSVCLTKDRDWIRNMPVKGKFVERIVQGHPIYAAMVSHLDDAVGKIVAELKNKGLYENTIIVFTSDNGGLSTAEGSPTSNLPLRFGKGWGYDGGVREPLIVRWPGVAKANATNESIITSPDFFPTILDMLAISQYPEQSKDGVSFAETLKTGVSQDRGPIFWHYPHYSNQGGRPCGAIRLGNYKLYENFENGEVELYNLSTDISETNNISALNPSKTKELLTLLAEWRRKIQAKMPDFKY